MQFTPLSIPTTPPPDDDPFWQAAAAVAGGAPPLWLYAGLKFYDWMIGGDHVPGGDKTADAAFDQARRNIAQLIPFLEALAPWLSSNYDAKELAVAVVTALKALPIIAEFLPKYEARARHRPGDQRYALCAGLVVVGWRMTRRVEPTAGGHREAEACRAYWRACGHDDADGGRSWERDLRAAIRDGDGVIRTQLQMLADRLAAST